MMILVTGGSGNGKSTFAEKLVTQLGEKRIYLATMRPFGEGAKRKIARHCEMRAEKGFTTVEKHTAVNELELVSDSIVLLECMCNLTANEMFDDSGNIDLGAEERIFRDVVSLSERCGTLVVVTNDVGTDYRKYDDGTNLYVETLGRLNRQLAKSSDLVYEVVVGIPLLLKGERL